MATSLRAFVFRDSLQPQLAAHNCTTCRGYPSAPHVASLFTEIAPGMAIRRVFDAAVTICPRRPRRGEGVAPTRNTEGETMRQLERRLLPAILVTALAACGGADSPEELADVVVSRLQDGDYAAYVEDAVAKPEQVIEVCPNKTEYSLDQAKHQEHFNACLRRFNFSSAEISNVVARYNTAVACDPGVGSTEEIAVTVVNETEILTFKIQGALQTEDGWLATGTLGCPDK